MVNNEYLKMNELEKIPEVAEKLGLNFGEFVRALDRL